MAPFRSLMLCPAGFTAVGNRNHLGLTGAEKVFIRGSQEACRTPRKAGEPWGLGGSAAGNMAPNCSAEYSQDPWSKGARMQRYLKEQYHPVAATAAKSLQSCPTLCNPKDGSPPGSPIPGILQARTLEWEMLGWKKHKLESRLPGEISITSDMQMTPPLW